MIGRLWANARRLGHGHGLSSSCSGRWLIVRAGPPSLLLNGSVSVIQIVAERSRAGKNSCCACALKLWWLCWTTFADPRRARSRVHCEIGPEGAMSAGRPHGESSAP